MNKKIDFGLKIYVFSFLVHIIMIFFLIVFWNDIDFYSINYVFNKKKYLIIKNILHESKRYFFKKKYISPL
jgi:hypothetical protein